MCFGRVCPPIAIAVIRSGMLTTFTGIYHFYQKSWHFSTRNGISETLAPPAVRSANSDVFLNLNCGSVHPFLTLVEAETGLSAYAPGATWRHCGDGQAEMGMRDLLLRMLMTICELGKDWSDPSKIPVEEIVEVWREQSKKGRYESAMWRAAGLEEPNA